jgi:glycosyltransferase involved in cell wall biosynthesis
VNNGAELQNLWIVVPAFNEATCLGAVVERLRARFPRVIVVDDGSSDGTAHAALAGGAIVLRHPFNLGQGAALQTGITFALLRGASLIATFDADGQHQVSDIQELVEAMRRTGADVAIGSRFLGSAPGMEWHRHLLLWLAVRYTSLTTGLQLTDAHNGLRLFTRRAAERIHIRHNRMAHASEILGTIARLGLTYVEVPVTVTYSDYSKAKGQRTLGAVRVITDLFVGRFR